MIVRNTRHDYLLTLIAVSTVVLVLSACASSAGRSPADAEKLSAKLTPFTYYDEGDLAFIGADTRAAQYIKDESMFPVGIAIVNKTLKSMTISRESFTLEDGQGKRYPLVSYEEFRASYRRSNTDDRLSDNFVESMIGRFINFSRTPLRLFPNTGSNNNVRNETEIARRQMALGYVYFPVPEGGVHQRTFRLLVKMKEFPETFVVRFKVR